MINRQTIFVAGATGNIGGGAAMSLAKRDANVVLLGRKLEKLITRAETIRKAISETSSNEVNPQIETLVIDFTDMQAVRQAAEQALNRFPEINGLIHSAVALVQDGPNILPNGHELMFTTNILGPFFFTQLLMDRLQQSDGLVLHVINPSTKEIDWDDLESIKNHVTETAYERSKMMHRMIAGEMARRYAGKVSSVAFNPTFIIDKNDPELKNRWPSGFLGFFWRVLTMLFAKPPEVAGEPIANLMFDYPDRSAINGSLFKLDKRIEKPDKAMQDKESGRRLWEELVRMTSLETAPNGKRYEAS